VTYRDPSDARRAEIDSLEERLRQTEHQSRERASLAETERVKLENRLERSERALDAYRTGHGVLELLALPWTANVLWLSGGLFAFAIVLRVEHLAYHADAFAKSAVVLSVFGTFNAWRAAGQTQIAFLVTAVKVAIAGFAADALGGFAPPLGPIGLFFFWLVPPAMILSVFLERVWLTRLTEPIDKDPAPPED